MFTPTADISPFVQKSQQATDFFVGSRSAFGAVRKSFGNGVAYIFAPVAISALWLLLWMFRKNLRALYSNDVVIKDYKKTRRDYDLLNIMTEKIGHRDRTGLIKQSPWIFRGSLRLAQDIFDLIRQRRDAIGMALAQMDASAPFTDLLLPVSEKDLWSSRTKAYDYRF